ncbi:HD-GYP domain-containing protein [Pseudodesulfovibrio sp. zrk46]|uniref:HD-GYP domain-containing protein n=1 Tax=Pseudodesulfovibrio sp. zrk46 TaxID=2725288 RepID=UPI0014494A7C|nr:HD-GYP domain-containing protein [Pseudodesulfovibrio sp. zrk46]QJB55511.1 HD-GYP domain-containing protein [Pseudodesulfovibrio sp. zrk46]
MLLDNHSPAAASSRVPEKKTCSPSQFVTTILHQFAESLGNAIDAKDPHTSRHSDEVAQVAHTLALAMGLSPREADIIHVAGHLHDIGKIGVPDAVLQKQGPLSTKEWQAVRKHSEGGAAILRPVAALEKLGIVDMVLHHHERYDGKGYPKGLKGTEIPLGARIITLADALSAMLQNRPYRGAMDFDVACKEIERCSGTHFDPRVVEAFRRSAEPIRALVEALSGDDAAA